MIIGIYTVMNEFKEIRIQLFVHSTSRGELEEAFKNMVATRSFLKHPDIEVFYTDVCCQDSRFLHEVIPSLKKDIQEPSLLPLDGVEIVLIRVVVCKNGNIDIENMDGYQRFVKKCDSNLTETVVGFDCEWNADPAMNRFAKELSLMQIAFSGIFIFL